MLQINIERVRAVTIKALLTIQGIRTKAIVDTGAEVTVMSEYLYNLIPDDKKPCLEKPKRGLVVAEAGKEMSTSGIINAEFKLGEFEFSWPVYVAPIRDDILLGCDIIDEMNITVNTRRGIQVRDTWVECEVIRSHDAAGQVKVARAVTVPASSEFIMTGQCVSMPPDDQPYLFEASEQAKQKLLIARSLISPNVKKIPVKMINQSNCPIRLKKGHVLGNLLPVKSIMSTTGTYDITKCEDESVVCRTKPHFDCHLRKILVDADKGNEQTDDIDFSCLGESESGDTKKPVSNHCQIPEIPKHIEDLYNQGSTTLDEDQKQRLASLLLKYKDTFAKSKNELGKCSVLKHHIDTAESAPVRQPMRRTPQAFEGEEEKYLNEQLATGAIKPSKSEWASPIVMVRKKTGDVRVCIDYRKLNERTIKDAYPLPRIDMCLDCLSSARIFSTIDLQSAYMQLEVAEEDQHKTAFITKYGLFEYFVMPFGLCNAPSTFQRCMELVFRGLQWNILLVYLDDIIVMACSFDEHLDRLEEVFKRLAEAGLKIKPSKCELFKTETVFLGHIVCQEGIKPNPKTVEAVMSWREPTTVREVQSFLGLCSYYRQYIKGFSHIAAPLTNLTKKKVAFVWDCSCQKAFESLKETLCSSPVLAYPKPGLQFLLDTDASDVGIGAVLSQVQDGKERVVAYASKRLTAQQERYSVTRRELLAVVTFVNQFRHYLLGQKFLLRTDHGSIRWLFEFKDPKGQVARWLETLAQYNFDIEHRPGSKHHNADGVSRKDYLQTKCEHNEQESDGCSVCLDRKEEWKHFFEDVDDVVDLGVPTTPKIVQRVSGNKAFCLRAFTRGQAKTQLQTDETVLQDEIKNSDSKEITEETMFLPSYSCTEIQRLQREDLDLGIIHTWMDEKKLPSRDEVAQCSPAVRKGWLNFENLVRRKGVLYQKRLVLLPKEHVTFQLLIPKQLRNEVIRNNHDVQVAGHFGIGKTIKKIRSKFWWWHMDDDTRLFIHQCNKCNKNKVQTRKPKAKLGKYLVGYPMDRLGLDIIGPLPLTEDKNKYILVIGDYFTRWMEAYSLPSQHTERIADKLVHEFIARFGTPFEIHSDQGRNFESFLFKEVLKLLEVKKTRTTAYRPKSNGLIERFNKTLGQMIEKFADKNHRNWDKYLSLLLAAYRATPHPATGFSPNMLMFGREVNLPGDILFPFPRQEEPSDVYEYVQNLRTKMEEIYHIARKNLKLAAERQKRDYDSRAVEHSYSQGDVVYKKVETGRKLDDKYSGPYVIVKVLSPAVYKIQNKKQTYVVHHDRLKHYQTEPLPKWVVAIRKQLGL